MPKNIKILHYTPTFAPAWQYGGPILSISQLCESLIKEKQTVEVFTTNSGLKENQEILPNIKLVRNGVAVTYFDANYFFGIHSKKMEKAICERLNNFDILHISGIWQPTSYKACVQAKKQNIPYIISPRGSLCPYSWQQKKLKKRIYYFLREKFNVFNASKIHYTSIQEKNECKVLNIPVDSFIVPNGINTDFWKYSKNEAINWKKRNQIPNNKFLILNIGRLHHKKGLDLIPSILSDLKTKDWLMTFIGGDDDFTKSSLIDQFKKHNLLENILFLDSCKPKELIGAYSASDIFILPSRHENFGNVVIESLACETPVVISDKVGIHNEINNAEVGWVLPREAQIWSQFLNKIINNKKFLESAKSKTRNFVESKFSDQSAAKTMLIEYEKIIREHIS